LRAFVSFDPIGGVVDVVKNIPQPIPPPESPIPK
jgi:hypothetical protein